MLLNCNRQNFHHVKLSKRATLGHIIGLDTVNHIARASSAIIHCVTAPTIATASASMPCMFAFSTTVRLPVSADAGSRLSFILQLYSAFLPLCL